MTELIDFFDWRADSDMDGDVEVNIFQLEDDVHSFFWDLGVFWNHDLATAAKRARDENENGLDFLPQWMQDLLQHQDKEIAEQFVVDVINRVPRSEQRVVDHMEPMLSHVLRAVSDVSKTPFMLYDAKSGVWATEGEWANEKQVGTSVGSMIDLIIRRYTMAMARAVDLADEMVDELYAPPGTKPSAAQGATNAQGLTLAQWTAAVENRKRLIDKVKEAQNMVRFISQGKNRAVKSALQDRLGVKQTYWNGPESMRWLILKDGVLDLEDVHKNGRMDLIGFSPWHASTMALDVSWSEAERLGNTSEWARGIEKIVDDPDVRRYLQKRYGAALLGRPGEAGKSMVWQYGVGDTGKSTIQEAIAGAKGVFAPYAYQADAEVLTQKGAERGATDRFAAYVRGKRFAIISELDAGAQLSQGKFKTMTGGETVSGTAKYSNEVTYFFTATLFVSSNHAPNLPYGDTALNNRIHIVPFVNKMIVRSKVSEREWNATPIDKRADEGWLHKLLSNKSERAAILKWVLEGLIIFGSEGLGTLPAAVQEARRQFVEEGDPVSRIVNSLLGQDDDSTHVQRIQIYSDTEWERNEWQDAHGVPLARMDELIKERARELGLADDYGDVSKKQINSAKKMLDELGACKGKAFYGRHDDGRTITGTAFKRVREVALDASSNDVVSGAPGFQF